MAFYSFTKVSANVKTGPIPVTMTDKSTCPDSCALKKNGCYAESGNVNIHWQRLGKVKADGSMHGKSLEELIFNILRIPAKSLWRHNVAGDLTVNGQDIDTVALRAIAKANKGKRGFTYTHAYTTAKNRDALNEAITAGFTINLSANGPEHADQLLAYGFPVVCLVPENTPKHSKTPSGAPIVVCPATRSETITCASCGLCAVSSRKSIVGFPVHGTSKKKAAKVISIKSI